MNRVKELIIRARYNELIRRAQPDEPPDENTETPVVSPRRTTTPRTTTPRRNPRVVDTSHLPEEALNGNALYAIIKERGPKFEAIKSIFNANPAQAVLTRSTAFKTLDKIISPSTGTPTAEQTASADSIKEKREVMATCLTNPDIFNIPPDSLGKSALSSEDVCIKVVGMLRQLYKNPNLGYSKEYLKGAFQNNGELWNKFAEFMTKTGSYKNHPILKKHPDYVSFEVPSGKAGRDATLLNSLFLSGGTDHVIFLPEEVLSLVSGMLPDEYPKIKKYITEELSGSPIHEAIKTQPFVAALKAIGADSRDIFKKKPQLFKKFISAFYSDPGNGVGESDIISQSISILEQYFVGIYEDKEISNLVVRAFTIEEQKKILAKSSNGDIGRALKNLPLSSALLAVGSDTIDIFKTSPDLFNDFIKAYSGWVGIVADTNKLIAKVLNTHFLGQYNEKEILSLVQKIFKPDVDNQKLISFYDTTQGDSAVSTGLKDILNKLPAKITRIPVNKKVDFFKDERTPNGLVAKSDAVHVPGVDAETLDRLSHVLSHVVVPRPSEDTTSGYGRMLQNKIFGIDVVRANQVLGKLKEILKGGKNKILKEVEDKSGQNQKGRLIKIIKYILDPNTVQYKKKQLKTDKQGEYSGDYIDPDVLGVLSLKEKLNSGKKITKSDLNGFFGSELGFLNNNPMFTDAMDKESLNNILQSLISSIVRDKSKHASLRQIIYGHITSRYIVSVSGIYNFEELVKNNPTLNSINGLSTGIENFDISIPSPEEEMTDERIQILINDIEKKLRIPSDKLTTEFIPKEDLKNLCNECGGKVGEEGKESLFGDKELFSVKDLKELSHSVSESADISDRSSGQINTHPYTIHYLFKDTHEPEFHGVYKIRETDPANFEVAIGWNPKHIGTRRRPNEKELETAEKIVDLKGSTRDDIHSGNPLAIALFNVMGRHIEEVDGSEKNIVVLAESQNDVMKQLGESDFVVKTLKKARVLIGFIGKMKTKNITLSSVVEKLSHMLEGTGTVGRDENEQESIEKQLREIQDPRHQAPCSDIIPEYDKAMKLMLGIKGKSAKTTLFDEYTSLENRVIENGENQEMFIPKKEIEVLDKRQKETATVRKYVKHSAAIAMHDLMKRAAKAGVDELWIPTAYETYCKGWSPMVIRDWQDEDGNPVYHPPTQSSYSGYEDLYKELGGKIDSDRITMEFNPEFPGWDRKKPAPVSKWHFEKEIDPVTGKREFSAKAKQALNDGRVYIQYHGENTAKYKMPYNTYNDRNGTDEKRHTEHYIIKLNDPQHQWRRGIFKQSKNIIVQAIRSVGELYQGNLYFASEVVTESDGFKRIAIKGLKHTYLTNYFRKL